MPAGGEWPPALRDFASRVFASCTDANRQAASDELKGLIFKAFREGTLYTTDWANMKLTSLERPRKRAAESYAAAAGYKAARVVSPMHTPLGASASGPAPTARARASAATAVPPPPPPGPPPKISGGSAKKAGMAAAAARLGPGENLRRAARAERFEREQAAYEREQAQAMDSAIASTSLGGRFGAAGPPPEPSILDWDADTVVGTSTKLEKPYLRLTSAPDPKSVRPLATLRKTLELLKNKWRAEGNYAYICDQFKSMRQDLTVQRIANDFTVRVYEIHARIALEKGDLGEYNQCQSQLRILYGYGLPGAVAEFTAYHILYLLHTRNWREVSAVMADLASDMRAEPAVVHALDVRACMSGGNYHRFFKLYREAPNMGAYIMDHFVERERVQALLAVARSFRPSCPVRFIVHELGFDGGADEAHRLLESLGAAVYVDAQPHERTQWDTRASVEPLTRAADRFRRVDIKGQL
ncbi:hypothetical protein MCUN1_002252 [Malassezia cuniculi]|uniref:SAC3/GANP/THP3 conserved domain-containing protein n=1 Tax=Malassezia cuniculi TaxID=948313 RepID=A0AAF0J6M8_9BASI|nr:hypothetical protein MCUN1_002252 [Malassezia cuniculi]